MYVLYCLFSLRLSWRHHLPKWRSVQVSQRQRSACLSPAGQVLMHLNDDQVKLELKENAGAT